MRIRILLLSLVTSMFTFMGLTQPVTSPALADQVGTGGVYVPVSYSRLVNTQDGTGGSSSPFGNYETRTYTVLGKAGLPTSGVSAVLVDITAVSSTSVEDTRAIVWPTGSSMPSIGQIHYNTETVPRSNTLAVAVSADGKISIQSGRGTTHMNLDVQGYFTAQNTNSSAAPGGFVAVDPVRVADTATGVGVTAGQIMPGSSRSIQVTGAAGIPADATTVFANISIFDINADGDLKVAKDSTELATALPRVQYSVGGPANNGSSIALNASGGFMVSNVSPTSTNGITVKVDIQGYWSSSTSQGGGFVASNDDNLANTGISGGALAPGEQRTVQVLSRFGVPEDGVGSVMLSVEAYDYTANGNIEVIPAGDTPSGLANVSFNTRQVGASNSTTSVVKPGADDSVVVVNNSSGTVHMKLNLQGWFKAKDVFAGGVVVTDVIVEEKDAAGNVTSTSTFLDAHAGQIPTDAEDVAQAPVTDDGSTARSESGSGGTTSSSGCRTVVLRNKKYSYSGIDHLYTYRTYTTWCWNRANRTISNVSTTYDYYIDNDSIRWKGRGRAPRNGYYAWYNGYNSSGYKNDQQGHFENCYVYCIGDSYPRNVIRSHSNGTWTWYTDD